MDRGGWVGFTPYCLHRKPAAAAGSVCSPNLGVTTTPSRTEDARGEGRGWCAMLRVQDAQPNACQGRLRQQWRHLPAQGCRVGRREGAAMMPPLGCRPASVRSTRPSLQLELQHHFGTGIRADRRSWLVKHPNLTRTPSCNVLACGCAGK